MSLAPVISHFRATNSVTVMGMLNALNIPYRKQHNFWLRNEDQLEYLYSDFNKRVREVRAALHPDRTGDHETASIFGQMADKIDRIFRRHGVGPKLSPVELAEIEALDRLGFGRCVTSEGRRAYAARHKSRKNSPITPL